MKDLEKIKADRQTFLNDTTQMALKSRHEQDFDLYRLKPYDAGKGYISFTSNSPRTQADKAIALLDSAELLIKFPTETLLDEESRRIANNTERLLYGALNLNDARLLKLGLPTLRRQMDWFSIIRGSFFLLTWVHKEKGVTIPQVDVWDSYMAPYCEGKDGLEWIAPGRKMSRSQVKAIYGKDVGQDYVEAVNFFDTENYGVFIENDWVVPPEKHGYDYCPVNLVRVGSMPQIAYDSYTEVGKHLGESFFAANRDLFASWNKTLSDLLTMVRRGVKVPLGIWSADGTRTLDQDIYQVEKAGAVPMRIGEDIKPIFAQTMPADSDKLLGAISGEIQRGGFTTLSFGELGFRLSGFAVSQLSEAQRTVIIPYVKAVEAGYQTACQRLAEQFASQPFPGVKVRGITSSGDKFGYPMAVEITPAMINKDWMPEVVLSPVLPKDDAQRYQLAKLARSPDAYGQPMLSRRYVQEDLLGVKDTDLEDLRIAEEWGESLPTVRLQHTLAAQLAAGDMISAQYTLGELNRALAQMMPKPAAGIGANEPGLTEMASMGSPGTGVPPGETGMTTEAMPPEMMGGFPPGAV